MSTHTFSSPENAVPVMLVADAIEDGCGMVRTPGSPPVVVAVLHDGTATGAIEAEKHAALLRAAPDMLAALQTALAAWAQEFDGDPDVDLNVPGADLVDWFSEWRDDVRDRLRQHLPVDRF